MIRQKAFSLVFHWHTLKIIECHSSFDRRQNDINLNPVPKSRQLTKSSFKLGHYFKCDKNGKIVNDILRRKVANSNCSMDVVEFERIDSRKSIFGIRLLRISVRRRHQMANPDTKRSELEVRQNWISLEINKSGYDSLQMWHRKIKNRRWLDRRQCRLEIGMLDEFRN